MFPSLTTRLVTYTLILPPYFFLSWLLFMIFLYSAVFKVYKNDLQVIRLHIQITFWLGILTIFSLIVALFVSPVPALRSWPVGMTVFGVITIIGLALLHSRGRWRDAKWEYYKRQGRFCMKCDYSLAGLEDHVCPECGTTFEAPSVTT